jgi:hypothetical protein
MFFYNFCVVFIIKINGFSQRFRFLKSILQYIQFFHSYDSAGKTVFKKHFNFNAKYIESKSQQKPRDSRKQDFSSGIQVGRLSLSLSLSTQ